ncbi:MAG: AGE family epimerase/isomerase [Bacteroidota bacterium]
MPERLHSFKKELEAELEDILAYWMKYDTDEQFGGFTGRVDQFNNADLYADKGSVLNSRILWTFSAAYHRTKNIVYLQYAARAYHYFINHFIDKKYGGVYWSVNYKGDPADKKKQVYAQSFAVYALSEFFLASGLAAAKQHAIELFEVIEQYSFDKIKGGYIDAFAEAWTNMQDMSLSAKDANEKKTMNTHLHILEAYTSLYRIWSSEIVAAKIRGILQNFFEHIIDRESYHLVLFFDENWNRKSNIVSYGHDIEASWLLQEAAEVICEKELIDLSKKLAVKMADAAWQGLDTDGGLWYEYEPEENHLIKEKHWWPQAEAMVGFFNAWQVSGQEMYLQSSLNSWEFTKKHIRDRQFGEWVWGIHADYSIMQGQDKIGIWKCPYHNGRACIEIIKRIEETQKR